MNSFDDRQTRYRIQGDTADTVDLRVSGNTGMMASSLVKPNPEGNIDVFAEAGPDNTNEYGFFYLGVVRLIYEANGVPERQEVNLLVPNGGEYWQAGKEVNIQWESRNITKLELSYSLNGGTTWSIIDSVSAAGGHYTWRVPSEQSNKALFRIRKDTLEDSSAAPFTLSKDTTNCIIAVLGSSTAEGAGASRIDSSWVGRFTQYLKKDTRFSLLNFGMGGYTSYHILPSDFPFLGIGFPPDPFFNITRAISFKPMAVILNMPSNDAAYYFPAKDQMDNFRVIANNCSNLGISFWITTSQPRNFDNPDQLIIQKAVRDSILQYFGSRAINLWDDLADTTGFIKPIYDAGGGVHLNDQGHRFIYEQVLKKDITHPGCMVGGNAKDSPENLPEIMPKFSLGKSSDKWRARYEGMQTGIAKMYVYNEHGALMDILKGLSFHQGLNEWEFTLSDSGISFVEAMLEFEDGSRISARLALH